MGVAMLGVGLRSWEFTNTMCELNDSCNLKQRHQLTPNFENTNP